MKTLLVTGRRAIRRRLAAAMLVLLPLYTISWLAARLLIVTAPLDRADVVVVLSGSSTYLERAQKAAMLFRGGHYSKIILTNDNQASSWSSVEERNPFYYERSVQELIRLDVPKAAIEVLLKPVSSTHDEAVVLASYAREHRIRSMLVVTSAYHSRRALWIFRKVVGVHGIEVGLDPVNTWLQTPQPITWCLYPRGWRMVPSEYLKLLYYHVRFRS